MSNLGAFQNSFIYYSFNILWICILLSEIFIFLFTYQKRDKSKQQRSDKGTKWLLIINFVLCVYIAVWFISESCPLVLRNKLLPYWVSYIGILFMLLGIIIRLTAVFTLKRAFTLNVQTTNEQHLITTGIYHKIRHPAYTGSVVSLVGIALSSRNVFGIIAVFLLNMICYSVRIHIEETALKNHFKDEYEEYSAHTFRLFPYIW